MTDSGGTTSYLYTADGQRLLSSEPGSVTTLYLGQFELRRSANGVTGTRHYGIASRTAGGELTWIAADHHGTGQVAVNATTLAVTRRKADPFGNVRGPAVAWPTTRGFVDGVQDTTGLTHLGAREYDPGAHVPWSLRDVRDRADDIQIAGRVFSWT